MKKLPDLFDRHERRQTTLLLLLMSVIAAPYVFAEPDEYTDLMESIAYNESEDDTVTADMFRFENGVILGLAEGKSLGRRGRLVIPDSINGEPVVSIGPEAFKSVRLIGLTLPSSVTSIGERAFEYSFNPEWDPFLEDTVYIIIGENVRMDVKKAERRKKKSSTTTIEESSTVTIGGIGITKSEKKYIGENQIDTTDKYPLPVGFIMAYNKNGKKADKYCFVDGYWVSETDIKRIAAEGEIAEMRRINFGWRLNPLGFAYTSGGSGSEWFHTKYPQYDSVNIGRTESDWFFKFGIGLTANVWLTDIIVLASELNYSLSMNYYPYGGHEETSGGKVIAKDYLIMIKMYNHSIDVPILLRVGKRMGPYLEAGYQFGFPIYTTAEVSSGELFPYGTIDEERKNFSRFRVKTDQGIAFGFGYRSHGMDAVNLRHASANIGFRFLYHLTKWDKDGNFKAPFIGELALIMNLY